MSGALAHRRRANVDFKMGSVLLVGEDAVLGDRSRDENREFNMQLMRVSKSTAEAVALRHLGLDPYRATGVGMSSVREPAADHLTTGDVIVAVDGVSTMKAEDLIEAIHSRFPGDVVVIDIEAVDGSDPRTVSVTLGTREDDPTIGFLGIGAFGGVRNPGDHAEELEVL